MRILPWSRGRDVMITLGREVMSGNEEGIRFFRNRLIQSALALTAVPIGVSAAYIAMLADRSGEPIILHFNAYFGVDLLGDWWQLSVIPGALVILEAANIILAKACYDRRERMAAHILLFAGFFSGVVGALATAVLYHVNS